MSVRLSQPVRRIFTLLRAVYGIARSPPHRCTKRNDLSTVPTLYSTIRHQSLYDAVAQRTGRRTCDQQVAGSSHTRRQRCITTLGKLFTPMPLSPSSITWYRHDSVCSHWMSLQDGQNLHSGKLIKIIKILHGHFVHSGRTLTDLQIFGHELHQNAFAPGPAGGAIALPQTL